MTQCHGGVSTWSVHVCPRGCVILSLGNVALHLEREDFEALLEVTHQLSSSVQTSAAPMVVGAAASRQGIIGCYGRVCRRGCVQLGIGPLVALHLGPPELAAFATALQRTAERTGYGARVGSAMLN